MVTNRSLAIADSEVTPRKTEVKALCDFAARGLEGMFDPTAKLFCRRYVRQDGVMFRQELSRRYTMMTLLGLLEYERSGGKSPIDLQESLDVLLKEKAALDNIGDVGLLLWLCAKAAPERMSEVDEAFGLETVLDRYRDAQEGNSMELSWFLTGASYAAASPMKLSVDWPGLAHKTYDVVRKNQGDHGFFGHLSRRGTFSGMFRGCVGSFADQVYPIYAFSKFSTVFGSTVALAAARQAADAICSVQGPFGQWWWHYDAASGHVVQRYPVYSVHQHAMAPMALIALKEAAAHDLMAPMFKGLNWIFGHNELNTSMCDESSAVIWRAIQPKSKMTLRAHQATAYLRLPDTGNRACPLKVLFHCWPYELGWLLYAFSNFQF